MSPDEIGQEIGEDIFGNGDMQCRLSNRIATAIRNAVESERDRCLRICQQWTANNGPAESNGIGGYYSTETAKRIAEHIRLGVS